MVGYNSEGNFYQNHPASGFASVADIISCGIGQQGGRRKRQADPSELAMLELPTDPDLRQRAETCVHLYMRDIFVFQIDPTELADLVSGFPCPTTLNQVLADTGRYVLQTSSPLCYVSANPQTSTTLTMVLEVHAAQQCCYENGY